jgi:hypothetical protein
MTSKSDDGRAAGSGGGLHELYGRHSLAAQARRRSAGPRPWIATEDLIGALIANAREPIPDLVLDHLRQRLDGVAKKPRGRKKLDPLQWHLQLIAPDLHQDYFAWLENRRQTQGLKGWACIRDAEWWQGPPHERAARMVARRLMPHAGWRHVLNLVSEARQVEKAGS